MRGSLIGIGTSAAALGLVLGGSLYAAGQVTGLPATRVIEQTARIVAAEVGRIVYAEDLIKARALAEIRGHVPRSSETPVFVFERPDAPHLAALRSRYPLDRIIGGANGEYDAQLKLAAWVGTRFEHGSDPPPGGRRACDTVAVIEAGQRGARYWCEVAAYTMIHAAQAMGWPARMITASTDGYTWEHAVAELWSREHGKWYVIDADFNVVFEHDGVPLSAWELVHEAPVLQSAGRLVTRRFAPLKQGLYPQDVLRFFAYAHLDYRTDWCSRELRRASPAGGDMNTRWISRPGREPPLSAIRRQTVRQLFEFPPTVDPRQPPKGPASRADVLRLSSDSSRRPNP
jgi:hypothetical protein